MADDNRSRQPRNNTFVKQVHTPQTHCRCVSVCLCTAKVQLCICSYWQAPHWEEVMPFVPLAVICDDICAWWNLYPPVLTADDIVFSGCPSHSWEYLWNTWREFLPGLTDKMIIFWWTNTIYTFFSQLIFQHHKSGTEGETVTIFHIRSDTEWVTLILGAHLEAVLTV